MFVGVSVAAFLNLPEVRAEVRWSLLLAAAFAGVPVNLILNGIEYRATARILGHRVAMLPAIRVAILSTAANQLPIPGSVLVRTQAIKDLGSSYPRAAGAAVVVGGFWAATSVALAGAFQLGAGAAPAGAALLAAGVAGIGVCHALAGRLGARARLSGFIVVLQIAFVAVAAVRLFWIIQGLGFEATFAQAVILSLAGVAASAVGIFPGGLGIREAVAGGLGPLVGLPASVALAAASVDRLVGLAVLAPVAGALAISSRTREAAP